MLKSLFHVGGKPFFSIGGQVNNSSAYDRESYCRALNAVKEMGMNTVAAPIYWEILEPCCGQYCFDQVEMVISETEKRGLKAVLLWFGSWKNGTSRYIPEWMKQDRNTYRTCQSRNGFSTAILSPLCHNSMEKDARAFQELMSYVEKRNTSGTVLAVQVENEPGLLGVPRDYSSEADSLFFAPVPEDLAVFLSSLSEGRVYECFQDAGGKKDCNFPETFGFHAQELFSAYLMAKYVEYVAAKGKSVSALPLYVNVWIGEQQFQIPGIDFPSGGATALALDIWKHFAPHLDCISPDVYQNDLENYMQRCSSYHRKDNLLYIPESRIDKRNGKHLLRALQFHELSSIHCFGIDSIWDGDGSLLPGARDFKDTVTILRSMKPLIEKYQGTGRLCAVAQYDGMDDQLFDFGDYYGRVAFLNCIRDEPYIHLDSHHYEENYMNQDGVGLIVYEGNGSFYLAGRGYKLLLLKKGDIDEMADTLYSYRFLSVRNIPYLQVEEGYFDDDGAFVPTRKRNGDETDTGLWVTPDIGVLHARLLAVT